MAKNTKARSQFLMSFAAEIVAKEHIDPANPPAESHAYIAEIEQRGKCHRETARAVWTRYLQRARLGKTVKWGGKRQGAGRPKVEQVDFGNLNVGDRFFTDYGTEEQKMFVKKQKRGGFNAMDVIRRCKATFDGMHIVTIIVKKQEQEAVGD